jgi:hypothetical protein
MLQSLESIISSQRLGPYLLASSFDLKRAIALYGWNMQLCAAFLPLLSSAEVCLRNRVVDQLCVILGPDWWLYAATRLPIGPEGIKKLKMAERAILKKGNAVDGGRLTAELSFGFWDGMFLPKYEAVLWQDIHVRFPDLPPTTTLAVLHARCVHVRELRNRIFHHEPIFQRNISQDYAYCLELIRWLHAAKADWIKPQCNVMSLMRTKP